MCCYAAALPADAYVNNLRVRLYVIDLCRLDFKGCNITGTAWNNVNQTRIENPPFDKVSTATSQQGPQSADCSATCICCVHQWSSGRQNAGAVICIGASCSGCCLTNRCIPASSWLGQLQWRSACSNVSSSSISSSRQRQQQQQQQQEAAAAAAATGSPVTHNHTTAWL
jgi:hypothetical protein